MLSAASSRCLVCVVACLMCLPMLCALLANVSHVHVLRAFPNIECEVRKQVALEMTSMSARELGDTVMTIVAIFKQYLETAVGSAGNHRKYIRPIARHWHNDEMSHPGL